MAKKVETKNVEIKAKKIGKNLVVMIGKDKHVKPNITDKDLKSIQTKILTYNKTFKKEKLTEILTALKSEVKKEVEKKEVIKKGITKAIKKETKKSTKKVEKEDDPEKSLIDRVREGHAKGEISDSDIKGLQDLLKKIEEEKETVKQETKTESNGGYSRERYR